MSKTSINIVWFKRDLRFTDNEALFHAHNSDLPLLLVYCFEPSVMNYDDSDTRHWRFIYESLQDLQKKLDVIAGRIYIFQSEIQPVFLALQEQYDIKTVLSTKKLATKLPTTAILQCKIFFRKTISNGRNFKCTG